jgi:alpha-1,2-mannosyltransferase
VITQESHALGTTLQVPTLLGGAFAGRPIARTPIIGMLAAIVWIASGFYMWHFGRAWHLDLRVYRDAARSFLDHGSPFLSRFTSNHLPFTYTPFALLMLIPLSFGPLGLVEGAWWLVNSAALVVTLYLLISRGAAPPAVSKLRSIAVASLLAGAGTLLLEPVRSNMDYGQINLLLMCLVVVDLNQSDRRFRGIAIGVAAAIKLTPLVYLLYFAVRRDWRSFAQGVVTFISLSLVSWLILPGDSALYWLHEATDAARTGSVGSSSNQSLFGMLHRAPFHSGGAQTAVWIVLCVAVVVLGGLIAYRLAVTRRPLVESVLVLAFVELLISPISWSHHWSWMAVAPIAAFTLWRDRRCTSVLIGAAIAVSVVAPYWWGVPGGVVGFVADNSLVLAGLSVLVAWAVALEFTGPQPIETEHDHEGRTGLNLGLIFLQHHETRPTQNHENN